MKKVLIFAIAAALLIAMTVPGYSWTGRMAGMGNPYGLVEDESDFLTHPTAITQGKGWQYYGDLGISYIDVKKWDYDFGFYAPINASASGHEWTADASFGVAFPVNTGRMGVFVSYSGNGISPAQHSGTAVPYGRANYGIFDLKNEYDAVAAKAVYAQPFTDKVKFGGEFGIARVFKERNNLSYWDRGDGFAENLTGWYTFTNFMPYMFPYDSKYWETNMKASVEGIIGSSKLNVTVLGGFILGGDNNYDRLNNASAYSLEGSVSGWNIGAEAWWRFPVSNTVAIPVLVKALYSEKKRDGTGYFSSGTTLYMMDYNNREKRFNAEVGAGVDAKFGKGRFAAGLYYGYTEDKFDFFYAEFRGGRNTRLDTYPTLPEWTEHRVILKLAGGVEFTPAFALNGGLNFFYSPSVKQDFEGSFWGDNIATTKATGNSWGIGLSAGAVVKFNGFTFEPYLKGGYQRVNISGDGIERYTYTSPYWVPTADLKKNQWNIGGGFAVKFN